MDHLPQPRGDRNEITTSDQAARETASALPLTFAEAEQHNAYTLLTELHDHALTFDVEGKRPEGDRHHLAELALSAAVVVWWSRWQPISMHRAFLAGASLAEVAAATGTTEAEVCGRWAVWAEGQAQLWRESGLGVDPAEVAAVRAAIAPPP